MFIVNLIRFLFSGIDVKEEIFILKRFPRANLVFFLNLYVLLFV